MPSRTIRCRDAKHLVGKYAFYVPVIGGQHRTSLAGYHLVTGFTRISPYPDDQDQIVLHANTGDSQGYWADTNVFCYYDTRDEVPDGSLADQQVEEPVQGALF